MDSDQLALEIQLKEELTFENYYKAGNEIAYNSLIKIGQERENNFIYLYGEQGVGKTHLLHAACNLAYSKKIPATYITINNNKIENSRRLQQLEKLNLICLDNIHNISDNVNLEENIFHLFNKVKERNNQLVLSANNPPNALNLNLKDLISRLSSCIVYKLKPLEDEGKLIVLKKRAQYKGLCLDDSVGLFLLHRCSRSISDLFMILDTLDKASLKSQRRLTIPFVKEVLGV